MTKRLRGSFGLDIEPQKEKCPGEAACGMFKVSQREAGDGLEACRKCPMLPTKPAAALEPEIAESRENIFFGRVFDARARMRLYELDKSKVTYLQFEMAVAAEQLIETFEREAAAKARIAQEENLKLLTSIVKGLAGLK